MHKAYCVLRGLVVAISLYIIVSLLLGVVSYAQWFDVGKLGFDIIHYLVIAIAAFIAAKKAADKGWLVGFVIAFLIAAFSTMIHWSIGEPFINLMVRSGATLFVGTLSGVIGVNI